VKDINFGVDSVAGNSSKIGFGRKKSDELSMCSHCQI